MALNLYFLAQKGTNLMIHELSLSGMEHYKMYITEGKNKQL
jgi:hypothetical protein